MKKKKKSGKQISRRPSRGTVRLPRPLEPALCTEILQRLNRGEQVSRETFPDFSEYRIRNAMVFLQQELASAAFIYDSTAITIVYRNAEGVRQIYDACREQINQASAKVLVQRFIKELGLPEPSFEASFHFSGSIIPSSPTLGRHFLQEVLELALVEARGMKKDYLGTPHLFIALTRLDGGCTQDALQTLGYPPEKVREVYRLALGSGKASSDTPILPTRRCKMILQQAEHNAVNASSDTIDERAIAQAILSESDGVTHELLIKLEINPTQLLEQVLLSNAHALLELNSSTASLQDNYFSIGIVNTKATIRGLPSEFPIFVPILGDQQMREEKISEAFQELFQTKALALGSRFGLILSSSSSPFLRNVLTQRDESGVKENVVYLDEEEMRAIITAKDVTPRVAFLNNVGKQVRFATLSPFYIRGTTPGVAFVGRQQEMSEILNNIASQSYVVLGGRRIGKTSMLAQVMLQLRKRGYQEFYLDCQSVETYHDFFRNIRLQWAKNLGAYTFANDRPITFQEIVSYLSRSSLSSLPIVFVFDEIDRILKFDMNQDNPEPLFRTFRALSQQKVCQFILSGERRIYHQSQNTSSSLFNFSVPIKLGLLNIDEAQKLIEEPLSQFGIRLEGGHSLTDTIVDACSCHPNLIQEMGHRILELMDHQQPGTSELRVTKEIVTRAMNQPDFIKHYLEVFWGQSNVLEKAITLLAPSGGTVKPSDLVSQLKYYGFKIGQKQFDVALDYLTLYCIFQQDSDGMRWTATHFKEFVSKTIFDQQEYIADLRDEFSGYKGEV